MSPGIYALWVIAVTGVLQMIWGFARDTQFLKKNGDAIAWDNERQVLIENCQKAEADVHFWQKAAESTGAILASQQKRNRFLQERLQKAGIDDTE